MKVIHGNKSIKQFKCEYCSYATHARPYLYEHRRSVHPEARGPDIEDTGYGKTGYGVFKWGMQN